MVSGELKLQLYRAFAGISSRILNPQTIHHKTVGPKLSWNWTRYRAQPGLWELQESVSRPLPTWLAGLEVLCLMLSGTVARALMRCFFETLEG